MIDAPVPSVFITWAHRHRDWSPATADQWERTVAHLASSLQDSGVPTEIDLWHLTSDIVDWTRYGPRQVGLADYVIVAASSAWRERWEGTNLPTEGAGAAVEADALKGLFDENQAEFQRKVKVVILPGASNADVPHELHRLVRYNVSQIPDPGFLDLLRMITGQPKYVRPPLGAVPVLGPSGPTAPQLPTRSDRELLAELARVDAQIKQLPSLEPGDGPHLPWYRAWHRAQSNRAALLGQLDALGATPAGSPPVVLTMPQMAVRRESDGRWFAYPPHWKGPGIEVRGWHEIAQLRDQYNVVDAFASEEFRAFCDEFGRPPTPVAGSQGGL